MGEPILFHFLIHMILENAITIIQDVHSRWAEGEAMSVRQPAELYDVSGRSMDTHHNEQFRP
jgi:hypothetical protein